MGSVLLSFNIQTLYVWTSDLMGPSGKISLDPRSSSDVAIFANSGLTFLWNKLSGFCWLLSGAPVFKNCTKEARYPLGTKGASLYCDIFSKPEYTGIKWQGITVEVEVTNSVDGSASDEIQTFTRVSIHSRSNLQWHPPLVLAFSKLDHCSFDLMLLQVELPVC